MCFAHFLAGIGLLSVPGSVLRTIFNDSSLLKVNLFGQNKIFGKMFMISQIFNI